MVREFSEEQIKQYREDGFLIVENLMSREVAATLAERFEHIFDGHHDLVNWPDQVYCRRGVIPKMLTACWQVSSCPSTEVVDNSGDGGFAARALWGRW